MAAPQIPSVQWAQVIEKNGGRTSSSSPSMLQCLFNCPIQPIRIRPVTSILHSPHLHLAAPAPCGRVPPTTPPFASRP
ncbi:hypothetical protein AUP68_03988 [Ilyonectria robusta]